MSDTRPPLPLFLFLPFPILFLETFLFSFLLFHQCTSDIKAQIDTDTPTEGTGVLYSPAGANGEKEETVEGTTGPIRPPTRYCCGWHDMDALRSVPNLQSLNRETE